MFWMYHPHDILLMGTWKNGKPTWKSGNFPRQLVQPSPILNARSFKLVQVTKESIVFRWSVSLNNFSLENMGPFLFKLSRVSCHVSWDTKSTLGRCEWPQVLHEKKHPQTECYDHPSPPIVVLVVMDLAFLRFGDARGNSYVPGTATGLLWRSAKLWRIGATFSVDRSCGAQISRHSAGLVVGDFWIQG